MFQTTNQFLIFGSKWLHFSVPLRFHPSAMFDRVFPWRKRRNCWRSSLETMGLKFTCWDPTLSIYRIQILYINTSYVYIYTHNIISYCSVWYDICKYIQIYTCTYDSCKFVTSSFLHTVCIPSHGEGLKQQGKSPSSFFGWWLGGSPSWRNGFSYPFLEPWW